jgi:GntR family transcriptional repressor for pyruvate dehydrogenase complex
MSGVSPRDGDGEQGRGADAGFTPAPVRPAADQVRLAILDAIVAGQLRPGDRLPSEIEQARGFRVSRTAVRTALRSLAEAGLITTVQGRGGGSFVNHFDAAPVERNLKEAVELLLHFDAVALDEILEARRALEGICVRLGAERRPRRVLDEIARVLDRASSDELSEAAWLELDIAFHRAVARSAENRVLTVPLAAVHGAVQPWLNHAIMPLLRRPTINSQHRAIYEAIRDGEPDAATTALYRHVDYLERLYRKAGVV